ncbi:hypothetical protein CQW23_14952 [Capsicum baccatum]|uniref:Inhibitor I9 domain-containing protein n=1 Tax=Capsicum baccatum TaxID=33114 RepID=A0A2G2WKN1_CAPBA|nr:hypothetical protein CQW23_14952 [Capsicum baccatum]
MVLSPVETVIEIVDPILDVLIREGQVARPWQFRCRSHFDTTLTQVVFTMLQVFEAENCRCLGGQLDRAHEDDLTPSSQLIHSYRHVISGFASRLTYDELQEIEKNEEFITAKPQKMLALHTTHTLKFLGLQQNGGIWQESNYGRGVIIGLLKSGITSDHPSFHNNNMPPLPAKWKGKCEFTDSVTCNNKLIGARNLLGSGSSDPPFDYTGHGTHTSSMAVGNFVDRANIFWNANGSLVGMALLSI